MNSLTLTIKTPPLIFLYFPLEFTIEKPLHFVSLLFIFWGFKHLDTSFLNLRKGHQKGKQSQFVAPSELWAALLRTRVHSTWNTTWKVVDTKLQVICYYKEICMSLLFCSFYFVFFFVFKQTCSICFPKRRASQHQTRVQVKLRDSEHGLWSLLLGLNSCSTSY